MKIVYKINDNAGEFLNEYEKFYDEFLSIMDRIDRLRKLSKDIEKDLSKPSVSDELKELSEKEYTVFFEILRKVLFLLPSKDLGKLLSAKCQENDEVRRKLSDAISNYVEIEDEIPDDLKYRWYRS